MKNKKDTFWNHYKKWFIWIGVILLILYFVIYLLFLGDGFIPTGVGIEKNNWLDFLGTYLSFAGTVFVSFIAVFQNHYYTQRQEQEKEEKRMHDIQPIFSVNYEKGTMPVEFLYFKTMENYEIVKLAIQNVGEYPISNVIVFESEYVRSLLKKDEEFIVYTAYKKSPNKVINKKDLVDISMSDIEVSEEGVPKSFCIEYQDIDGNRMSQTFSLETFNGNQFYSLFTIDRTMKNKY